MIFPRCLVVILILAASPRCFGASPDRDSETKVRAGMTLQLVAAEPLVMDPVSIDWGPDGKLWVVEMADYPYGMDGKGKPGGRVRYLEDTDGDGLYDKSTLFLDQLTFPTSVMTWRKGVLVTAAPTLFHAEDTDGDGSADRREVLFEGFVQGNQQLRVNGLRWGLDNWVYCASGGHHAGFGASNKINAVRWNQQIPLGSRDFRFRPDSGEIDPQSGPSQFGRVRDDWGNWFGVQNSHPLWHYVLSDHYLRRNHLVASPDSRHQVRVPANPKVYPAKTPQKRFHSFQQSGHYTSACGPSLYRDDLLFPADEIHGFTCEPFHNLVQHHELEEKGVSFSGRRADDGPHDFFASTDRWCRPVMSRTGPDGAVWIVDMYRYMIEHPDWLPPEGKEELRPHYRSGEDKGRIYRVYPTDDKPRSFPRLDQMTPRELVDVLTRGNGVLRDMAARMLVGMRDISVVPMLVRLSTEHDNPRTRLHALCVLDGLESLTAGTLKAALDDKHPAVRRHAIRLTEKSTPPDLLTSLIQRVDDSSASVRLQLACTLGAWPDERAGLALAELATRTDGDHFMNSAIISSAIVHYEALVDRAMRGHVDEQIVAALLTMGTEFRRPFARLLDHYLTRLERAPGEDDFERVDSWLRTLNERRVTIDALRQSNDELSRALNRLTNVFETAMNVAGDVRRDEPLRTASIRSLGHHRSPHNIQFLSELLGPQHAPAIQLAAVGALGTTRQEQAARTLLTRWGELSPAVREAAIDQLLSRESWCQLLVEAIGKGVVKSVDIDLVRRERLLKYPKKSIVSRALQLLGDETNQDREDVVTQYQSVLHLTGDAKQGEKLFGKHCATCHESDGDRPAIGADLRAITDRSAASLLRSILAPSQSVEPRYLGYNVVLQSGETVFGMVAAEAGNSLQLRMLDGKSRLVLRDDIESLQSSRLSIMPNGLETQLNRQQLADVIRFVQTLHESDDPPD